jgi:hypothetical protein
MLLKTFFTVSSSPSQYSKWIEVLQGNENM